MGTYLSTPVLDKCTESGENLSCPSTPLAWGVVDMQGWRKSMEDSHIVQTDVEIPKGLAEPPGDRGGGDGGAASDPSSSPEGEVKTGGGGDSAKVFAVFDGHGGPEVARFCQLYLVSVLTSREKWTKATRGGGSDDVEPETEGGDVGAALVEAFHAMDRMVDDPKRRDEIIHLKTEKPQAGERRSLSSLNGVPPMEEAQAQKEESAGHGDASAEESNPDGNGVEGGGDQEPKEKDESTAEAGGEEAAPTMREVGEDNGEDGKDDGDDDSNAAVGHEEFAAERDAEKADHDVQDDSDGKADIEAEEDEEGGGIISSSDAMALFQKLLSISGASAKQDDDEGDNGEKKDSGGEGNAVVTEDNANEDTGPSVITPTRIQNGRQICNLPDHAIHAGCTSVVAVLIGQTLTVANAGDSRAVLCRAGGITEPLSFDHKPLQDREMTRITQAGGFVNQFGRVNGNLNLSRSIGDLKYKQVPGIPPSAQMITAEPDIIQVILKPGDEFIILGCDGIWDCLSNEEAVKYVRDRLDTKTPTEIGIEMLDEIVSDDPRASQGIGGDNMTIMVVDLLPHTRVYRSGSASS